MPTVTTANPSIITAMACITGPHALIQGFERGDHSAFCPNKFDATSDATWARFAATIAGCTVTRPARLLGTDTAAKADRPRPRRGRRQPPDVRDAAASAIAADADLPPPSATIRRNRPNDIAAQCSSS